MSENISMPAARIPLVDDRGLITREWMAWFIGMFKRAGGSQGFSNQELYGSAETQQNYDELLERIGALEARNRDLVSAVQMLSLGQIEQMIATPPQAVSPDTFARIKVLGETDLATDSGGVRIRKGISGSSAALQVNGNIATSTVYQVGGTQVVGDREAGFPAPSAYAGQTMDPAYNQAQVQTTDDAVETVSIELAALITALRSHGLIGD